MTTKTKPPTPLLLGRRIVLGKPIRFGVFDVTFMPWKDAFDLPGFRVVAGHDSNYLPTLPAAVRWAEGRVLATKRALEKVRGK